MKPWTPRLTLTLWHPESPGGRVVVVRAFPWWRRSSFATSGEVLRMYRQRRTVEDWTDTPPEPRLRPQEGSNDE